MLEVRGCRAGVVANGREAVAAVIQSPYDLVLMDCQMPEMDGYEASRALRQGRAGESTGSARPLPPIVALTAHALQGDRERCLAAGMDDYLSKPFSIEQLRTVLARWLSREPAVPECLLARSSAQLLGSQGQSIESLTDGGAAKGPDPAAPADGAAPTSEAVDGRALDDPRTLEAHGASGLVARAVAIYVRDAAAHVQAIQEAVAQGDAAVLRERAHSLKSASAYLGAVQVATVCQDLERFGATQAVEAAEPAVSRLAVEYERARVALVRATAGR